jgi:hypothetical protein
MDHPGASAPDQHAEALAGDQLTPAGEEDRPIEAQGVNLPDRVRQGVNVRVVEDAAAHALADRLERAAGRLRRGWMSDGLLPVASGPVQQFYVAVPLLVRLPVAAALVAWGARTDRAWTVPAGAALAAPVLWLSGSIVAAIPAIERFHSPGGGRPMARRPR